MTMSFEHVLGKRGVTFFLFIIASLDLLFLFIIWEIFNDKNDPIIWLYPFGVIWVGAILKEERMMIKKG